MADQAAIRDPQRQVGGQGVGSPDAVLLCTVPMFDSDIHDAEGIARISEYLAPQPSPASPRRASFVLARPPAARPAARPAAGVQGPISSCIEYLTSQILRDIVPGQCSLRDSPSQTLRALAAPILAVLPAQASAQSPVRALVTELGGPYVEVHNAEEALSAVQRDRPLLLLIDLCSGDSGERLLRGLHDGSDRVSRSWLPPGRCAALGLHPKPRSGARSACVSRRGKRRLICVRRWGAMCCRARCGPGCGFAERLSG